MDRYVLTRGGGGGVSGLDHGMLFLVLLTIDRFTV